jgi:hypothetical protein
MKRLSEILIIGSCLLLWNVQIFAKNYYVSSSLGSDSNSGVSISSPKKTIQSIVASTAPGDTVLILNGTYNSTSGPILTLNPDDYGSEGKYIVYKAYSDHHPKITASGNVWNAVSINASYVVIDGLELEGNNKNITYEAAYQSYLNYLNDICDWSLIANYNTNALTIGGSRTDSKTPHHHKAKSKKK